MSDATVGAIVYQFRADTSSLKSGLNDIKSKLADVGTQARQQGQEISRGFDGARSGVEKFNKSVDKISEFAWKNTSFSGDEIDRVANPIKMLATTLGLVGAGAAIAAVAVGGAMAYIAIKAHEAQTAVKSMASSLSFSGSANGFAGQAQSLRDFAEQSTKMNNLWDVFGKGGALSAEEAKKLGTELAGLPKLTDPIIKGFVDLAREEKYAFGSEGLEAVQSFAAALKKPETALQTLLSENTRLTPAQRAMAQAAIDSGNAQRQAATYFDLVTQNVIRQKAELLAAETATNSTSEATKRLAAEVSAAASGSGNLEDALRRLASAGISAAGDLLKVASSVRSIRAEMGKGGFGADFIRDLHTTIDQLDPASKKVRETGAAWGVAKQQVSELSSSVADLEKKQAALNAVMDNGRDANGRLNSTAAGAAYTQSVMVARELAEKREALKLAQEAEQLRGRDQKAAIDEQRGKSNLDAKTAQIELKYSINKDEVAKAKETTLAIQAELDQTPVNEHFLAKRQELMDKLLESQKAEADAEKAVSAAKLDYDIAQTEKGEAQKKLIRQKYEAEMAGIKPGTAEYWNKKAAMEAALEGASPSEKAKPAKEAKDAVERYIDSQKKALATAQAEAETWNKSNAERAEAVALARGQAAAEADGKKLTDQQAESIKRTAREIQNLKDKTSQLTEMTRGISETFAGALDQLIVKGGKLNDVMRNLAQTLMSAALKGVLTGEGMFGSLGGAPGGGGILGGLTKSMSSGLSSLIDGQCADGGPVMGGRAYVVGERGPELFMPSGGGSIIPNGGGGGMSVQVHNYAGAQIETRTTRGPNNTQQVLVAVRDALHSEIANNGSFARALQNTYGLSRATGRG